MTERQFGGLTLGGGRGRGGFNSYRYGYEDEEYEEEQETRWIDRPWREFTWRQVGVLLWHESMTFWPSYLSERSRRPVSPQRRRKLLVSYAPDWIITVVLWIALYLIDKIDGFRREFSLTDTSLQHTFAVHERVPVWLLAVICVIPLAFYAAIGLGIMRSFWDFHAAFLGNVLSLALTTSVTTIIKVMVGRPRPDVIDRCQPQSGAANAVPYGLVTSAICTTDNLKALKEGFRSFPSGHASTAFAGLGFFALYMAGKLHLMDQRGHTVKSWIVLVPLMGATAIALTRTMDYRHHATDVIAGSLLGMAIAWFSYRLYYPPLSHPKAHKPYSPRIPDTENTAIDDDYEHAHSDEGPDGTVKRPAGGVGQAPPIAMHPAERSNTGSPYRDVESVHL